jgi:membrane protease YdiL (CAAX protease family)
MSAFGRMAQWDDRGICLGLLVQILSFHAIVLAGLMMIARRSRVTVSAAFGLSRPLRRHAGTAVILYAVSLPPIALASWLWSYFLLLAGITPDRQEIVNVFLQPGHAPMVYLGIAGMAVLMAPVFEEVVFRGLALPMLLKTCDRRLAVIAVSTVFACMHFHLPSIVPLFLVAFSLTLGYIFTGSLVTPVVMHFLFNLGSLLMYSSGAVLETADATAILPHIPPWTRAFASQP